MNRTVMWSVVGVVFAVAVGAAVYMFLVPHVPADASPDKMRKADTLDADDVSRAVLLPDGTLRQEK